MPKNDANSATLDRFIKPDELLTRQDAFAAALGHILLAKEELQQTVAGTILRVLGPKAAEFLVGMPFANQVDLLALLVSQTLRDHFESDDYSLAADMADFARKCHDAEGLWRTFLQADSRADYLRRAALGIVHSPDPQGRTWTEEECNFAAAQDAADAITCVDTDLSQFISGCWQGPPGNPRRSAPAPAPTDGDPVTPPSQPAARAPARRRR